MKNKFLQFIKRLTILSIILGLAALIIDHFLPSGIISGVFPYLIILFFIITAIVHYVLLRISALNPRKFVAYFMLATFLKLLNYMIVVVVYVLVVKEGVLTFILNFFILYIIYTVMEITSILTQTKE
jgi:hypothetical protein